MNNFLRRGAWFAGRGRGNETGERAMLKKLLLLASGIILPLGIECLPEPDITLNLLAGLPLGG